MTLLTCLLATFLAFYTLCAFRWAVDVFLQDRECMFGVVHLFIVSIYILLNIMVLLLIETSHQ